MLFRPAGEPSTSGRGEAATGSARRPPRWARRCARNGGRWVPSLSRVARALVTRESCCAVGILEKTFQTLPGRPASCGAARCIFFTGCSFFSSLGAYHNRAWKVKSRRYFLRRCPLAINGIKRHCRLIPLKGTALADAPSPRFSAARFRCRARRVVVRETVCPW